MTAGSGVTVLGRDRELLQVERALADGAAGGGGAITFEGPAGMGKSTMLTAAGTRARELGYTVLEASGRLDDGIAVHTIARQWFAAHVATTTPGEAPFDGPASALTDLVNGTDDGSAGDGPAILLGTQWALEALREQGPVLLLADDVQWVDEESRALVMGVVERAADLGVVLVAGVRTGDGTAVPMPGAVLALSGWGTEAMSQRLAEHLNGPAPRAAVAVLRELTRGVPFAVEESLAELPSDPGSLHDIVEGWRSRSERDQGPVGLVRVDDLSATELAVAAAVVTIGPRRASLRTVAEVADVPPGRIAAVVDALVRLRVLADGVEPLDVVHPLVAQRVVQRFGVAAGSELHGRALAVLHGLGHHAVDLAGHARLSPAHGNPLVVDILEQAADDALQRGAPAVAAEMLDRALREPPPAGGEVALLRKCAAARIRANDLAVGTEQYRAALARMVDPLDQVDLLIELADALAFAGDLPGAVDAFERARTVLDDNGIERRHPVRRRLLAHAGPNQAQLNASWQQDLATALRESLAQSPEQDTYEDRLLYVTASLGVVFSAGSSADALRLVRRGLDGTRLVREETSDSTVLFAGTGVLLWADQYDEDRMVLDAALVDARLRGSVLGHATASYCRGSAWYLQGEPFHAVADLRAAVETAKLGWSQYLGAAEGLLVLSLLELGDVAEARAAMATCDRDRWAGNLQELFVAEAAGELARCEGRLAEALAEFERADGIRMSMLPNPAASDAWLRRIQVLLELGRAGEAHAVLDGVRAPAAAWGAPRVQAMVARAEALLADDSRTARTAARRSADLLRDAGVGSGLVRSLLLLEDVDAAREALDLANRLQASALRDEANAQLSRLGATTASPASDSRPVAPALSPAESRVVELATTGLTNRQIAATLFVTVKAVEWHLTRVYQKFGLGGREQLAGILPDRVTGH